MTRFSGVLLLLAVLSGPAQAQDVSAALTTMRGYLHEIEDAQRALEAKYGYYNAGKTLKAEGERIGVKGDFHVNWGGWFWLYVYPGNGAGRQLFNGYVSAHASMADSIRFVEQTKKATPAELELLADQMSLWRQKRDEAFVVLEKLIANWAQQALHNEQRYGRPEAERREVEKRAAKVVEESDRLKAEGNRIMGATTVESLRNWSRLLVTDADGKPLSSVPVGKRVNVRYELRRPRGGSTELVVSIAGGAARRFALSGRDESFTLPDGLLVARGVAAAGNVFAARPGDRLLLEVDGRKASLAVLAVTPERLYFVYESGGSYRPLDGEREYGQPFFLQASFEDDPGEAPVEAVLRWAGGQLTVPLRQVGLSATWRSGPLEFGIPSPAGTPR